jgi:hypothetical protein
VQNIKFDNASFVQAMYFPNDTNGAVGGLIENFAVNPDSAGVTAPPWSMWRGILDTCLIRFIDIGNQRLYIRADFVPIDVVVDGAVFYSASWNEPGSRTLGAGNIVFDNCHLQYPTLAPGEDIVPSNLTTGPIVADFSPPGLVINYTQNGTIGIDRGFNNSLAQAPDPPPGGGGGDTGGTVGPSRGARRRTRSRLSGNRGIAQGPIRDVDVKIERFSK